MVRKAATLLYLRFAIFPLEGRLRNQTSKGTTCILCGADDLNKRHV